MARLARCDNPSCRREVELRFEDDDRLALKGWFAVEILGPLDKQGRPAWEPPATLGQTVDIPATFDAARPWLTAPPTEVVAPQRRFLFCSLECTQALQELTLLGRSTP